MNKCITYTHTHIPPDISVSEVLFYRWEQIAVAKSAEEAGEGTSSVISQFPTGKHTIT